jgi:integrase
MCAAVTSAPGRRARCEALGRGVRTVVDAVRSLYRWAQDRDHVRHDPAARVRLPAMNATPRDRVASPPELAQLLAVLEPRDALACALAAFATARRQEMRRLRWGDIDWAIGVVYLGADSDGRKTTAALRGVPLVGPLRARPREERLRQGRPLGDELVCPPRHESRGGLLSFPVSRAGRGGCGRSASSRRSGCTSAGIPLPRG